MARRIPVSASREHPAGLLRLRRRSSCSHFDCRYSRRRQSLQNLEPTNGTPLAIMGLIVSALWLTRSQPPPLGAVDGIYTSACCSPVQLKDGVLAGGTFRVPFKLEMEKAGDIDHPNKIGLVAVTPVTVGVRAGRVSAMPDRVVKTGWFGFGAKTEMVVGGDPARFIFSDDRKTFTLCEARCGTEYQFLRR